MQFRTKQDQVAEILRERIIAGEYRRGQKLRQVELSEDLGVSVTPVREALRILEAEGYVVGLSHRGVMIPFVDKDQAKEIFKLRSLLENELTEQAMQRMTPAALSHLRTLQRDCVEAVARGDRIRTRRANYRFHFYFYELAEQPQTLQFVRVLWARYPFTDTDVVPGRPIRMVHEHDDVLAHAGSGDLAGTVAAMDRHIRSGWAEYLGRETSSAA